MIEKKKILMIFGTRPEAIKMAPLFHRLKSDADLFDVTVCITAQHREMLDQVLEIFQVTPDIDLNIMQKSQNLFDITTSVLTSMKKILDDTNPDIVLVHGDTTTTLAASMACFYSDIKVAHVEAGLRTHNIFAPYPEEFNRQVTSKVAKLHFAPTEISKKNLIKEGVEEESIFITGNTVIDALFWMLQRIESDHNISGDIEKLLNRLIPFNWQSEKFILVTGHRRENFGAGFLQICEALRELASRFKDIQIVYPVHLNPNVQSPVNDTLADLPNIHLIEPLEYESFVYLLKHSFLVLTDSGGIQEEAPSLGKPVLVMREVTERPEAVNAGTVELVGADRDKIIEGVTRLLEDEERYSKMACSHNPYGDGNASNHIASILRDI